MKKTKLILLILLYCFPTSVFAQTLENRTTYFNPYTQTQISEKYTVIKGTPTKHGTYKKYDKEGTLVYQATYKDNKKNGPAKSYYGRSEVSTFSYTLNSIGKLSGEYHFVDRSILKSNIF